MHYLHFITLYNQNSLAKKQYYTISLTKKTKTLLSKFIELGLVKYVKNNKKNSEIRYIYINYLKNERTFQTLKILYKPSKKQNINLKTLEIKKQLKINSTFLLLTSQGLMTNFEAINKKIGGVLLCQINY